MTMTETQKVRPRTGEPTQRRTWFAYVLLAALLAVVTGAIGWWLGSDDGGSIETPQIVDLWNEAWIAGDSGALGALYAEDAVLEEPLAGYATSGRLAIQSRHAEGLRYADWTEIDPQNVLVSDDVIVVEAQNTGMSRTLTRSEMTPFSTQVMTVLELEDGLISRAIVYYDSAELFN